MIDLEKRRERGRRWWRKHRANPFWREVDREYQRLLLLAFPDEMRARQRRNYKNNPNPKLNWRRRNRDKCQAATERWRARNRNAYLEQKRKHRKEKWEAIKAQSNVHRAARRLTDLNYKLRCCLRGALARGLALRSVSKSDSAAKLLGCSIEDFKLYIESKFEPGMSWDNYGKGHDKWNIDHIMPCAIFDLRKPEHQKRCFHFSNLQPLWEPDNLRKRANVLTNQFQLI